MLKCDSRRSSNGLSKSRFRSSCEEFCKNVQMRIDGEVKHKRVETTIGRLIYNQGIPQDLGFVDRSNPEEEFKLEISFPVIKKNLKENYWKMY